MKNQILHLIRHAKAQGCVISVYDGEVWAVKKSDNEKDILEAIMSVDEAQIRIRDSRTGEYMGWALIIPELEKDEMVADCTDNEFMQEWCRQYDLAAA